MSNGIVDLRSGISLWYVIKGRRHTVGQIAEGINKLGNVDCYSVVLFTETARVACLAMHDLICLLNFFEHVLGSAGRRTPDASIGIEIAGKVPDAVTHG